MIKKTFIALMLVIVLTVMPIAATAQTTQVELEAQYRQALMTLISLLVERVRMLTAQLVELQANANKAAGLPYAYPAVPRGIEEATNKDITEEGTILPSVVLQARETVVTNAAYRYTRDNWDVGGVLTLEGRESSDPTWQSKLAILVNVGNPDPRYQPQFTCIKTGSWSGITDPHDHWEENLSPQVGEYGVRCTMPNGQFTESKITVQRN